MNSFYPRPVFRALLAALFLLSAHRLPAPIQEVRESPTPTPAPTPTPLESPNTQNLVSTVKPSASGTNVSAITSSSSSAWAGEMFPESRTRRLTSKDINGWDADKLRYAINELYARGGYDFRTPEIKQLFMRLSWYRERLVNGRTQDEAYAHLSPLERANLEFLQEVRRGKQ